MILPVNADTPLYVDLDDVICETAVALSRLLFREFGKRVAFEDIREFDLEVAFGINRCEWEHLMELAHRPEFLHGLQPVRGAVDTLRKLAGEGMPTAIVTGRPPSTYEASRRWLEHHGVPFDELIFVDKYARSDPFPSVIRQLPLAALEVRRFQAAIDDSPGMLRHLAMHTATPVFVFDRPWNRNAMLGALESSGRIRRCATWDAVTEALTGCP